MALQDSNQERRNLTVLSLSIIVFYLADGSLQDVNVKLQIINVVFSKPEVLANFAWILLFWFCFRYRIVHKGSWNVSFISEITSNTNCEKIYYTYLVQKFGLGDDFALSIYANKHGVKLSNQGAYKLVFQHEFETELGPRRTQIMEVETIRDKILIARCYVDTFFANLAFLATLFHIFYSFWLLLLVSLAVFKGNRFESLTLP
jgi:hypothetical protein